MKEVFGAAVLGTILIQLLASITFEGILAFVGFVVVTTVFLAVCAAVIMALLFPGLGALLRMVFSDPEARAFTRAEIKLSALGWIAERIAGVEETHDSSA